MAGALFSLAGKRAVVTGASKGIGAAIAQLFAAAGADVAVLGRDHEGLAATDEGAGGGRGAALLGGGGRLLHGGGGERGG